MDEAATSWKGWMFDKEAKEARATQRKVDLKKVLNAR